MLFQRGDQHKAQILTFACTVPNSPIVVVQWPSTIPAYTGSPLEIRCRVNNPTILIPVGYTHVKIHVSSTSCIRLTGKLTVLELTCDGIMTIDEHSFAPPEALILNGGFRINRHLSVPDLSVMAHPRTGKSTLKVSGSLVATRKYSTDSLAGLSLCASLTELTHLDIRLRHNEWMVPPMPVLGPSLRSVSIDLAAFALTDVLDALPVILDDLSITCHGEVIDRLPKVTNRLRIDGPAVINLVPEAATVQVTCFDTLQTIMYMQTSTLAMTVRSNELVRWQQYMTALQVISSFTSVHITLATASPSTVPNHGESVMVNLQWLRTDALTVWANKLTVKLVPPPLLEQLLFDQFFQ